MNAVKVSTAVSARIRLKQRDLAGYLSFSAQCKTGDLQSGPAPRLRHASGRLGFGCRRKRWRGEAGSRAPPVPPSPPPPPATSHPDRTASPLRTKRRAKK
eukprot:479549-Rhodomonas_salina.1